MNQHDPLFYFRVAAGIASVIVVILGMLLVKNLERIIPPKSNAGGENDSQRSYAIFIIFALWDHAFVLSASFALFIH